MARIRLKTSPEMLPNCYKNCTFTKQGLVEVRFASWLRWILSSSFGTQSRTQCFRWNSNRTPGEKRTPNCGSAL